jgi:serine-type D-Ala-D-Ala carboxypeptidase/endopeptidase
MLSVHRPAMPGVQIALGWHTSAGGIVNHNGQTNGYCSFLTYDSQRKVGVVVLSNSYLPIDDIGWRVFRYPTPGLVEQQTDIPNLHP